MPRSSTEVQGEITTSSTPTQKNSEPATHQAKIAAMDAFFNRPWPTKRRWDAYYTHKNNAIIPALEDAMPTSNSAKKHDNTFSPMIRYTYKPHLDNLAAALDDADHALANLHEKEQALIGDINQLQVRLESLYSELASNQAYEAEQAAVAAANAAPAGKKHWGGNSYGPIL